MGKDLTGIPALEIQKRHDDAFDVESVTKAFYKELANWYFWALRYVRFPKDAPKEADGHDHIAVIRMITRLIFCWFVKEKGLIPEDLFDQRRLDELLVGFAPAEEERAESVFYKAILQNLFFATLNTEMDKRGWARDEQNFMAHSLYRHRDLFQKPGEALGLFRNIPFLNGGLFECLDKDLGEGAKPRYIRIDGFSRRPDCQPVVPDFLFFGSEREEDLSEDYGDKKFRKVPVRGLIHTLNRYRFTIEENTPIEQEVALDPELSGKVFENLLAAYNPETGATARKQTGSFYTPREIVDYMVDEALIAFLKERLPAEDAEEKLRRLVAWDANGHDFNDSETEALISAIDGLKALDPAVGSGAFPMGILHKLVFILGKLDPHNKQWEQRQIQRVRDAVATAEKIEDAAVRERTVRELEQQIVGIEEAFERNELDYGRKLYLIENCLYGVDIQAIAVQIAKMRFFISLIVDQRVDQKAANLGIRPLPNLETKFVAANTLIGIERSDAQGVLFDNPKISKLKIDLQSIRHRMFTARTLSTKHDLREKDKAIRMTLAEEIRMSLVKANEDNINLLKLELDRARKALKEEEAKPVEWEITPFTNLFGESGENRINKGKPIKRRLKSRIEEIECELRKETSRDIDIDAAAKQLADWDPYDQNASSDFFDPEWMFGVADGFDITIGNPPYVRADSGEGHLKLRKAIERSGRYRTLWEKWDLYVPFIERGYQLLKPGGFTTMIVSDAFCHSKYALKPQEWFLKNACVRRLDFFSRIQIFDAAVRNITYLFQKADGAQNRPKRRLHDPEFGVVRQLPTDAQANLTFRVFFPEDAENNSFSGPTIPLAEICYITKGMVVHADEKVAQGAFQMEDLVAEAQDEIHPKPFVEGKHLDRWLPADRKWLEWGTDRAPALFSRPTFPELYEVGEKILVQRSPGPDPKACYDDQHLHFTESSVGFIPWHSLAGVRNKSIKKTARYRGEMPSRPDLPRREDLEKTSRRFAVKYLLAVMNSAAARDFLRANRRSNIHLYPDDWKQLPIPDVPPERQALLIRLVDRIIAARRADPRADISPLEEEVDVLVDSLYGVTSKSTDLRRGE